MAVLLFLNLFLVITELSVTDSNMLQKLKPIDLLQRNLYHWPDFAVFEAPIDEMAEWHRTVPITMFSLVNMYNASSS